MPIWYEWQLRVRARNAWPWARFTSLLKTNFPTTSQSAEDGKTRFDTISAWMPYFKNYPDPVMNRAKAATGSSIQIHQNQTTFGKTWNLWGLVSLFAANQIGNVPTKPNPSTAKQNDQPSKTWTMSTTKIFMSQFSRWPNIASLTGQTFNSSQTCRVKIRFHQSTQSSTNPVPSWRRHHSTDRPPLNRSRVEKVRHQSDQDVRF